MHRILHILFIISIGFAASSQLILEENDITLIQIKGAAINIIDVNSILNDSNLSENQKADSILSPYVFESRPSGYLFKLSKYLSG